jgi:hypothetical protein
MLARESDRDDEQTVKLVRPIHEGQRISFGMRQDTVLKWDCFGM